MLDLPVTLATTSLLTILFLILSVRVSTARMNGGISLGAGGGTVVSKSGREREIPSIEAAVRAHGNFAEYVPLSLLMLGLIEAQGTSRGVLIAIAVTLCVARVLHAIGISLPAPNMLRGAGAMLQYLVLLVLGGYGLVLVATKFL